MTIEEYKELVLQMLKMVSDCDEAKRIVRNSMQLLDKSDLPRYLAGLKEGLQQLSPAAFQYLHWCNIQCAILYLEKTIQK